MNLLKKIFTSLVIISTISLVICLRFYQLGNIPGGIALDEVNYGYDAYSIVKTGRDMWGEIGSSLKSFGEYKPIGTTFTLIPLIKIFGVSTFSTRLPSAIYGLLTLVIVYITIFALTKNKKISFIGAIILGLSPWHFGLSRQYYESNSGLLFIAVSIYFQIRYIQNPSKISNIIFSSIFAGIAGYYYQVLRYIGLGLIGVSILITHRLDYKKILKSGVCALVVFCLIAIPYLKDMFSSRGFIRLSQESAMKNFGYALVVNENREMCYLSLNKDPIKAKFCYVFWNKLGEKIVFVSRNYLELISPYYIFISSFQPDVVPENSGPYLEIQAILYLIGILYLFKNLKSKETQYILLAFLFSNIPIAISGSLGIQRNVVSLYFILIISVYGIKYLSNSLRFHTTKIFSLCVYTIIILGFIWNQTRYITNYYLIYTKMLPEVWHEDAQMLMTWLGKNRDNREIILYNYSGATLYYSFYNLVDPVIFQQDSIWSSYDPYGWTALLGIENLINTKTNITEEICNHLNNNQASKLLVIKDGNDEWQEVVQFQTKNFTGIHVLHEVYDSKILYDYLNKKDPGALKATCSSQK